MVYFTDLKAKIKEYLADESQGSKISRIRYATLALYSGLQDMDEEEKDAGKKEGSSESQQDQSPEEQIHSDIARDI